ncbi:MAG: preprotein translocase subunit YajC [Bacteroidetes bacterium]|nr:preprotein translocase subunit YajC [Bacteroidota bacterium]
MMNMYLLQAAGGGSSWMTMAMFGGIFVVMYFFMIRPQQKKQKELKKFRENIKEGDQIITIGGAYGTIAKVEEKTIVITVESGAKIRFEKSAISMDANSQMANQPK